MEVAVAMAGAVSMIMAMGSTVFQFMTMAVISMAMCGIQSTIEEGMAVPMA